MNETKTVTLDDAVRIARTLSAETQEALAHELLEGIEDFSTPERSPERQAIIGDRLAQPFDAISRDELMAILRRYDSVV